MLARRLTEADIDNLIELLAHFKLVTQDIDINKQYFIGIKNNAELIAIGALQIIKPYGLIRSVAVDALHQGNGYAGLICNDLIKQAKSNHLLELYLLTESASDYFSKHGFETLNRTDVPQAIRSTNQFSRLCAGDASVMKMPLTL